MLVAALLLASCPALMVQRRRLLATSSLVAATSFAGTEPAVALGALIEVTDPQTYSALVYSPPGGSRGGRPLPLLVVLHGAGRNEGPVWSLSDMQGEHAGLAPSLLASGRAPPELAEEFAMVAPYAGAGRRSFYEEPRRKLLEFVEWVCSPAGRLAGCPEVDRSRLFLFGFSDGATVAVELATTRRFAAAVVAAYGFTGSLPALATQRLKDVPLWFFHSADDAIFSVANSDNLVRTLRQAGSEVVRYTRYECDQEGFTGRVQGHSTGITASKQGEVYRWLLAQPPLPAWT